MPIDITGEFQPSDGVHGFDLYDPQDIKAGNVNVALQAVASGAFKGGSHATAPVGEVVVQVKTSTSAPTHSATEGTLCWNSVDDRLYVNNNGTTGWTLLGGLPEVLALADLSDVTAKTGAGTTIVMSDGPTFTGTGSFDGRLLVPRITDPASPIDGEIWVNGSSYRYRGSGVTRVIAHTGHKLSNFAATTSAELAGVISDETGSGALVFATSPTLVTPALGTPSSGTLTNCTGLPTAGLVDGTKLRTISRILYIENPIATDEIPIAYVPDAATMVAVRAVTDVGTVDFNIEKRAKLTPDVAGTNVWTVDKQATAAGLEQLTFDAGSIGADEWLHYSASAVASAPTKLWISLEMTVD